MRRIFFFITLLVCLGKFTFAQEDSLLKQLETVHATQKPALLLELTKLSLRSNLDQAEVYAKRAAVIAIENEQNNETGLALKYSGIISYYRNRHEESIKYYTEALKLFKKEDNELEYSNVLNNIALVKYDETKYNEAIELHQQALANRLKRGETKGIIGSYINIGNCLDAMGKFDEAGEYFKKGLEINLRDDPTKVQTRLLISTAMSFFKAGKHTEAIPFFEQAIANAQSEENYNDLITIYNNTGNVYYKLGDYEKAMGQFSKALDIIHLTNSNGQEGSIMLNIGNLFDWTNQYNNAKHFYKQAMVSFERQSDSVGMTKALLNIGLILEKQQLQDSAMLFYTNALHISEMLENNELMAMSYNAVGKTLLHQKEYKRAEMFLTKANESASVNQNASEMAKALHNLATLNFETGQIEKSKDFVLKSLSLNKQIHFVAQQMENLQLLCSLEESSNNKGAALQHLKAVMVLRDSLFKMEKKEENIAAEGKFNLKLKDQEIKNKEVEITQQNALIQKTKERNILILLSVFLVFLIILGLFNRTRLIQARRKVIAEKKQAETEHRLLRSQMNPHFMFNALNSIQSFIADNNSMQAEIYLSKFATLIRYYLESSSKTLVPLEEELKNMQLYLELEQLRLNHSFDFQINTDIDYELDDIDIPPLLVQPFIENAVWHGLRTKVGKGNFSLSFENVPEGILCKMEDNGIGRAASAKLSKEMKKQTSKGIEITQSRLKGLFHEKKQAHYFKIIDLYAPSGQPSGTRVEFIIPYKANQ